MTRLRTVLFLIFGYFSTILLEIVRNGFRQSSSPKITLFEHIQSSFTSTTLRDITLVGLLFLVLLMGLLMIVHNDGKFIVCVTLLKFFEWLPLLVDLINVLFIYQYKMVNNHKQNSSTRLHLSLVLIFSRIITNVDVIRRKCDCQWKRQMIIFFDLLLFILINTSLLRDTNRNLIRIGRKILLGFVISQLNNLFYSETVWTDHTRRIERMDNNWTVRVENLYLSITHFVLSLQWILPAFLVCFFIFFTFQSAVMNEAETLFSSVFHGLVSLVCILIPFIIRWDTLHNQNILNRYGSVRFSNELDLPSIIETTTVVNAEAPVETTHQTCSVCYDDKELDEFNGLITTACQHISRSVCDICLFRHVQQAIQITFTDDIHCPELECGIKFDYHTVKNILTLGGDNKLIERYDRYVFHRQLEQMEEFIWCTNPLCNVGQLNEGAESNNIVTCFTCHQKSCFTHKVQWHEGITCEEYDQGIDPAYESSRRWIVENSKKCPHCPYQIEKNDGCDHMVCIKCRHEFCWSCLVDFQPIRQDGNHRHRDTCKHYAAYDGE